MSREVLELMEKMDKKDLNNQLALQCAPLLTGIKPSNLLIVKCHSTEEIEKVFRNTGITVFTLCHTRKQRTLLLYREDELLAYLGRTDVRAAMELFGYRTLCLIDILKNLCARYQTYMENRQSFPHELGLLLGYPVKDVLGFIENEGQNYLYSGYWKVYADVQEAKRIFRSYNKAKERMIRLVLEGNDLVSMLAGEEKIA